jgi:hypothetical protein
VEVSLRFGLRVKALRVKALLNVEQGKMGCFEANPGGGKCGETDFLARRNGRSREPGNREALPLPKRGSPAQALIEFVFRLWLGEGVTRKALFIEKGGSGAVFLP